jgi:hypothetical protein
MAGFPANNEGLVNFIEISVEICYNKMKNFSGHGVFAWRKNVMADF